MDFNSQLDLIRKKHSNKHNQISTNIETERKIKKFGEKYGDLIELNKVKLAAIRIVRFFKKHIFQDCYYDDDELAGLNSFRILFTTHHILEVDDEDDDPEMRRALNMNINDDKPNVVLFRYCFNINHLYHKRNDVLTINNLELILMEKDIIRLERNWNKIYGDNASVIFITDLEFTKSLVIDQLKDPKFIETFINCRK